MHSPSFTRGRCPPGRGLRRSASVDAPAGEFRRGSVRREPDGRVRRGWSTVAVADRLRAVVFTENYGEAGAIDRYGPALGLPIGHFGHLSFPGWGPPADTATTRRSWSTRRAGTMPSPGSGTPSRSPATRTRHRQPGNRRRRPALRGHHRAMVDHLASAAPLVLTQSAPRKRSANPAARPGRECVDALG